MDRIKRFGMEILAVHKEKFGTDFNENKQVLNQISIVRSKGLKNELAGYITKYIKKEIAQQNEKEQQTGLEDKKLPDDETESKTVDKTSFDESILERQKQILSQTSN